MLRAYPSYTSNLDSTSLKKIYYYIRYTRETNILSIMVDIFEEQILQITMLAIFVKQARQTISIFLNI